MNKEESIKERRRIECEVCNLWFECDIDMNVKCCPFCLEQYKLKEEEI